jgi:hypothetical protein
LQLKWGRWGEKAPITGIETLADATVAIKLSLEAYAHKWSLQNRLRAGQSWIHVRLLTLSTITADIIDATKRVIPSISDEYNGEMPTSQKKVEE